MKIVIRDSDQIVVMVADCDCSQFASGYTIHDIPNWDWSMADMTGVDKTKPNWLAQMKWDGTNLVFDPLRVSASPTYAEKRAMEYPPMSELADSLYWASAGDPTHLQAYYDKCAAVKAKYPKPQ